MKGSEEGVVENSVQKVLKTGNGETEKSADDVIKLLWYAVVKKYKGLPRGKKPGELTKMISKFQNHNQVPKAENIFEAARILDAKITLSVII